MPEEAGLSDEEARRRLAEHGPNRLPEPAPRRLGAIVLRQLADPFTLILVLAGLASLLVLGDIVEGIAILAIVALNVTLSAWQEARAEHAMQALRELAAPTARVVRDGRGRIVPAHDLVPGDRVELEAGDRVPADIRLAEAHDLQADEAILTGESFPVAKQAGAAHDASTPVGDRHGMAHAGTLVVRGRGHGEVHATGLRTQLGLVAAQLGASPPPPLEVELRQAARRLSVVAVLAGLVMVGLVLLRSGVAGTDVGQLVLAGVALAVAALPEGLLAVVTLALSLGVQQMARQGAIVRHLRAIEALGSASVLCVDKTGTLTQGRLAVAEHWAAGDEAELWLAAVRCNDARDGLGDPVDIALLEEAARRGASPGTEARLAQRPFDAQARSMAVVHDTAHGPLLTVKGAPEAIAVLCPDQASGLLARSEELARRGLRVLAFAAGASATLDGPVRFLGLVAFADPLRPTARDAVAACRDAGIRVVMVTGDHPATARSTAIAAGLDDAPPVTGAELHAMGAEARKAALLATHIVARVEPATKVELVQAYRGRGELVAMMGDGVNDAPALQMADVGIAVLGPSGTDVARAASDLVLTRPDLGTVVTAVREGRRIRANIESVILYLLAGNLGEVLVVLGGLALFPGLLVPLTAVQLLWINLVTDGPPALALGVDRAPADPMRRPPRDPRDTLLSWSRLRTVLLRGAVAAACVLAAGWWAQREGMAPGEVQAVLFLALILTHLATAYTARPSRWSFGRGWWRNGKLLAAVAGTMALQLAIVAFPATRAMLGLDAIPAAGLVLACATPVAVLAILDLLRNLGRSTRGA